MSPSTLHDECFAEDAAYRTYFSRFFSVRTADGSIPSTEPVTQEVLHTLSQLQREWQRVHRPASIAVGHGAKAFGAL